MAYILQPKRWYRQPSYPVQFDWSHWLGKYNPVYVNYGDFETLDLIGRRQIGGRNNSPLEYPGNYGRAFQGPGQVSGAGSLWVERDTALEIGDDLSWMCFCEHIGTIGAPGYARPFSKTFNNGGAPYTSYDFEMPAGGTPGTKDIYAACLPNGGLATNTINSINTLNVPLLLGASRLGASFSFYEGVSRRSNTTSVNTNAIAYDTSSTGRLCIGSFSAASTGFGWAGPIYLIGIFAKALPAEAWYELGKNPWQFLQPVGPRIFLSTGAAGVTPKTLTASLSAAIQAALQATATLSAGIQVSDTRAATLDSALEFAVAATSTLQAAIQAAISANATLDGYVQAGSELSSTLDAGIQDAKTGTTSLNAAIEASQSATATLAAAIEVALAATATLDAAVAASALASSTLDAFIQAGTQLVATVDAAVQFAATASVTLSAAIAELRTGSTTLDAVLVTLGSVAAALDAAILSTRAATATLNAYIEDATAVEPRGSRYRVGRRPGYVVRG